MKIVFWSWAGINALLILTGWAEFIGRSIIRQTKWVIISLGVFLFFEICLLKGGNTKWINAGTRNGQTAYIGPYEQLHMTSTGGCDFDDPTTHRHYEFPLCWEGDIGSDLGSK